MLIPKKVKHRKWQKGKNRKRTTETRGLTLAFGNFGLQATSSAWMNSRQIESARRTITNFTKRGGKVWLRVFPDHSYTKKPAETRMGKGKGAPEYYIAKIKPGKVIFEMGGVPELLAKSAMRLCAYKLPFRTKFVRRIGV